MTVLAALLGIGAATGCAGPALQLETDPPQARVVVDGRIRGTGSTTIDPAYYGTHAVGSVPARIAPGDDAVDLQWRDRRQTIEVREPITPWLFPFDFVLEVATLPWRDRPEPVRLTMESRPAPALPPRPDPGTTRPEPEPQDVAPLRARAARARTIR